MRIEVSDGFPWPTHVCECVKLDAVEQVKMKLAASPTGHRTAINLTKSAFRRNTEKLSENGECTNELRLFRRWMSAGGIKRHLTFKEVEDPAHQHVSSHLEPIGECNPVGQGGRADAGGTCAART